MRNEIIYDGQVLEKRERMLQNLSTLVVCDKIYSDLRNAKEALEEKKKQMVEFIGLDTASHAFFDIKVGSVFYPLLTVGNYGIAVMGDPHNPALGDNTPVCELSNFYGLRGLKGTWFSNRYSLYENMVISKQTRPDLADILGNRYTLDFDVFMSSTLWQDLALRRRMIAEHEGCEQFMIFKAQDAFDLLQLYPDHPVGMIPISIEYQKVIIDAWSKFMYAV